MPTHAHSHAHSHKHKHASGSGRKTKKDKEAKEAEVEQAQNPITHKNVHTKLKQAHKHLQTAAADSSHPDHTHHVLVAHHILHAAADFAEHHGLSEAAGHLRKAANAAKPADEGGSNEAEAIKDLKNALALLPEPSPGSTPAHVGHHKPPSLLPPTFELSIEFC